MRAFLALSRLAVREAVRHPLCLLLTLTCILLTAIVPQAIVHDFAEYGRLVRDTALSLHLLFGLLIATHAAASAMAAEFRRGTAALILDKPVSRPLFLLARFAGATAVTGLFSASCILASLFSERSAPTPGGTPWVPTALLVGGAILACLPAGWANYRRQASFPARAFFLLPVSLAALAAMGALLPAMGARHPFPLPGVYDWRLTAPGVLVAAALPVAAAAALAFSTRLRAMPAVVACGCLFVAGLLSEPLLAERAADTAWAAALFAILPNWQQFWMPDALSAGGRLPWSYVGLAAVYGASYTGALLCLAVLSFRNREIDRSLSTGILP